MSSTVASLDTRRKRPPVEMSIEAFLMMRSNDRARSDFLHALGQFARPQITTIVTNALGHTQRAHLLIDGEAKQAFLITANAAIDSARTVDDGRGKNDPVKWCVWRGLNAVRELLRDIHCRRYDKPSKRQQFESQLVYQSQLEEDFAFHNHNSNSPQLHEAFALTLAQRGNYVAPSSEEELLVGVLLDEILKLCTAEEYQVVELLVLGHSGELELVCGCKGVHRHSLTTDLAKTISKTESQVRRIRANLEAKIKEVMAQ